MTRLIIYTDGLSKNNPGQAAIGATLRDGQGKTLATISQALGIATNNVAEYRAIIAALKKAVELGATQVDLRSDSELVVNHLNGRYRVKADGLRPLYKEASGLLARFEKASVTYIPRELNTEADSLANEALRTRK